MDFICNLPDGFVPYPLFGLSKSVEWDMDKGILILKGDHWTEAEAHKVLRHGLPATEKVVWRTCHAKSVHLDDDKLRDRLKLTKTDGFQVFELHSANTVQDFDNDIIGKSVHEAMAAQINREPQNFLFGHNWEAQLGTIFEADVVPHNELPDHFVLREKVLISPKSLFHGNAGMTTQDAFNHKLIQFVSVSFNAARKFTESDTGQPLRVFFDDSSANGTETHKFETSAVTKGGQRGAGPLKSITLKEFKSKLIPVTKLSMNKVETFSESGYTLTVKGEVKDDVLTLSLEGFADLAAKSKALNTEVEALKATIKESSKPDVDKILVLQGPEGLKMADALKSTEGELYSMTAERRNAIRDDLQKRYNIANPKGQITDKNGVKKELEVTLEFE